MKPNVHSTIKDLLSEKLNRLEEYFNADVFCYYGALVDGLENQILSIVEDLANDKNKRAHLVVILTTAGGSAVAVER